ncbi:FecR family protein [Chitinophaga nivalis]|uniref:FecR domain-containing protein n=1 Tax=Chitinophaga nivalis TaxID=2991709 RepID=A0ABT3IRC9_9BACT|nr:FecR family protein [Chitinophaga nivalis]MCW3463802.1 FecR domain-containing protein [Chitinophaga nivalis]MCW3486508.1 FecR domain-containing protein [Chitinophaga nivalis]
MLFTFDVIGKRPCRSLPVYLLITGALLSSCQSAQPADTLTALQQPGVHYTTYKGETGRRTLVTLPDSSRVQLNAASTLQVPDNYGNGKRSVLLDGDAFFTVQPATDSFIVTSDKLRAAGPDATFRMRSFAAQHGATVYLLHGKIQVGKSYHSATDNQPEILERGQMILANNDIDLMEKETYHPEELEAWVSDTLVIRDANVMAVSRILEDWFGIDTEIRGDASKARIISNAAYYNATLEDVLSNLSSQQDFTYKIKGNKAILTFKN